MIANAKYTLFATSWVVCPCLDTEYALSINGAFRVTEVRWCSKSDESPTLEVLVANQQQEKVNHIRPPANMIPSDLKQLHNRKMATTALTNRITAPAIVHCQSKKSKNLK